MKKEYFIPLHYLYYGSDSGRDQSMVGSRAELGYSSSKSLGPKAVSSDH